MPDGFTVASVGDLIRLLKTADITFGNFEGTALDLHSFDGFPEATSGGGWLLSAPEVSADLKSMGFSMVSRANNHATDWGVKGMLSTDHLLTAQGWSMRAPAKPFRRRAPRPPSNRLPGGLR